MDYQLSYVIHIGESLSVIKGPVLIDENLGSQISVPDTNVSQLPDLVGVHTKGMMTSSNGNIFRVTGPLCGEFTGHR